MVDFRACRSKRFGPCSAVQVFFLSFALATVGLWVYELPLWINIIPVILVFFYPSYRFKALIGLGWMLPIAIPTFWGLWSIGHPVWAVIISLSGMFGFALIGARIGYSVLSLILLFIPHWIASPVSMIADLVPAGGWSGVAVVFGLWVALDIMAWLKVGMYRKAAFLLTAMAGLGIYNLTEPFSLGQSTLPYTITERDLANVAAITPRGEWAQISETISPDATGIILGESATDNGATSLIPDWCRWSEQTGTAIYAGIRTDEGGSEAWLIDPQSCSDGTPVYRPMISIPGITGDWGVDTATLYPPTSAILADWMICFEAFSIARWANIRADQPHPIVVLSNDSWTAPLPVRIMRRKVAEALADLLDRDIYFADRGVTLLEIRDAD